MHLGGVVAPHDEDVALVEVLIAAGRLVDSVRRDEPGHRRGHAEARVRVDVIGRDAPS